MRFNILASSLLLSAFLGFGCGSGTNTTGAGGNGGSTGTAGAGGAAGTGDVAFMTITPCLDATSYQSGSAAIATTADFKYSPACLKITAGTSVTIDASTVHPLVGLTTGSADNPILAGPSTTPQAVTFPTPGFYPFHCAVHSSIGMAGVIWVQ